MKASLKRLLLPLLVLAAFGWSAACSTGRPAAQQPEAAMLQPAAAGAVEQAMAPPPTPPPPQPETEISRLRQAIDAYRAIAAAEIWPKVEAATKLEKGDSGEAIHTLRARLLATGDLAVAGAADEIFDAELDAAVRRFQERHGLLVDGIVGKKTLAALNTPIGERLRTLELNLKRQLAERRLWGERYIAVNAAAATYRLVEDGETVFERRVIVGRPSWPTPRLEGTINEIVFHPSWTVPPRIASQELLPRIRRDAGYLAAHNMRYVDGLIRQAPGPDNPLGKLKFVFPNDQSVYLHDTNAPSLFAKAERFLSHGCIRLSNAEELARHLLAKEPGWNDDRITAKLSVVETDTIRLTRPIPVHIVYDTAWVAPDGIVNFRDDVYRRDRQWGGVIDLPGTSGSASPAAQGASALPPPTSTSCRSDVS
jgi:murein L,D-transpeptidase YcbB/YkuD